MYSYYFCNYIILKIVEEVVGVWIEWISDL